VADFSVLDGVVLPLEAQGRAPPGFGQRAGVEELRGSRARILEAAQSERRRLERDLHDGAQQRLVTVSLELGLLADRDALTGLPNTRVFERAIGERLGHEQPFGLIVGCVDELASGIDADDLLRQVASRMLHSLPPGDEVARIGDDSFAVLAYAGSAGDAGKTATHLQALLAADGFAVTFGWAAYPQDGSNALSLYRAADERLYARRIIHRQPTVVPLQSSATSA